jgi:hypothetical protein
VEANDTDVEKHILIYAPSGPSRSATLIHLIQWLDAASVVSCLSPRRLSGVPTARASSQGLPFAPESVNQMQAECWERARSNATVPQHANAILFAQRQVVSPAIASNCRRGGGRSTADPNRRSPQSIYVDTKVLITMPQRARSSVRLLAETKVWRTKSPWMLQALCDLCQLNTAFDKDRPLKWVVVMLCC